MIWSRIILVKNRTDKINTISSLNINIQYFFLQVWCLWAIPLACRRGRWDGLLWVFLQTLLNEMAVLPASKTPPCIDAGSFCWVSWFTECAWMIWYDWLPLGNLLGVGRCARNLELVKFALFSRRESIFMVSWNSVHFLDHRGGCFCWFWLPFPQGSRMADDLILN